MFWRGLFYFLIAVFLFRLVKKILLASLPKKEWPQDRPMTGEKAEILEKDPVCGVHVPRSQAVSLLGDETYYFCSEDCRNTFQNRTAARTGT